MNNFKDLIEKYYIQIPIIQRDYAQGRNDVDVIEIRDNFLNAISEKLENNKTLHLDFIYGSVKKDKFIPLDGQQRLTTLFLLYFYFGKKENKDIEYLLKFTYETRSSSREFCQKLAKSNIDFSQDNLSKQIKNSAWFLPYWDNDPTIKSMLIMLDSIHIKFKNSNYFSRLNNITFEFFELEKFGLDDDLYIKMNARGKPLTPFENFKANFEQLLEKVDEKFKGEFSQKIDKEWIDIFWNFKDGNYLIDEVFMNYFYYISEMLYSKSNKTTKELSKIDIKSKIDDIYSVSENIEFLFMSIDKLPQILECFDFIFTPYNYEKDKVVLFDSNINLAKKLITNSAISLEQKIMLYLIIEFFTKNEVVNENLISLMRVARNLLERVRSLKQSQLYYTQNLRYENLHKLIKLFSSYVAQNIYEKLLNDNIDIMGTSISKISLAQEKEKAKLIDKDNSFKDLIFKLEDFKYLKGDINNFIIDDSNEFKFYVKSIIDIYTNDNDASIIQAMLTSGDYRIWRGWAGGSNKYFFGKKGYWEIVLTSDNKAYFRNFLSNYKSNGSDLVKMKNSFLSSYDKKDWKYYFIKYDKITNIDTWLSNDNNTFAWYDDFSLEKMGGSNLNAYHINPYIKAVAIKCNIELGWHNGYTRDWNSHLKITGKIKELYSVKNGWKIKFSDSVDVTLKTTLISKYNLIKQDANVFNLNISNEDRIEKMVNFIGDLEMRVKA